MKESIAMRCSTDPASISPGDDPCERNATYMLLGSTRDGETGKREPFMDPICKPCGEAFVRRPALKARLVPLHVHMAETAFLAVIEGHRLVKDPEHEARCFDCGTTGTPNWFRFQTNGCPGRPESITALYKPRESAYDPLDEWAPESARLWWEYAVDFLGMGIEDWRPVTEATFSAYFTFRDREYAVQHSILGGRFGAVKLPNRGRPSPEKVNADLDPYNQVIFRFHELVTDSGSASFAAWTVGREDVILYHPEGQIRAVLRIPGLNALESTQLWQVTDAVCDAFGAITDIKFQTRIYGETE